MEAIVVAAIGGLVAVLVEWMRRQNQKQHAKGYSLLESIDQRTMRIDDKTDRHGEWIARHNLLHHTHDEEAPDEGA